MEHPSFIYGNEQRFFDFVKKLDGKQKVSIISHTDLDGIASAKIVDAVVSADIIKFVDYDAPFSALVDELRTHKIKAIILTDFMIRDKRFLQALEQFADVLVIDHHPPEKDFNSTNTVFLNAQHFCAAYLCYYLFSKIQDLKSLDWLVACACLADWLYKHNASWLKEVYTRHGERFDGSEQGIRKGKFWEAQLHLSLALVYFHSNLNTVYRLLGDNFKGVAEVALYARRVLVEIEACVVRFQHERVTLKDGYFWEFSSQFLIKSLVINSLSAKYPHKTLIIGVQRGTMYYVSARRQDTNIDVNLLLQKLTAGLAGATAGGHAAAAGAHFRARDAATFKQRLNVL